MYSICTPFALQYLQLSVQTFSSQAFFITSKALSPPLSSTLTLLRITPFEGRKSFLPLFSFERLSYIVLHFILTVQYFFISVVTCVVGAVVEGLVVAGFVVMVVGFVVVIGSVVVTFEVVCFFVVVGFVVASVMVCCLVVVGFVVVASVVEYAVVDSVVVTDVVTTVVEACVVVIELLSRIVELIGKVVVTVVGAVDVRTSVVFFVSPQAVNVKIIRRIQI